MLKTSKGFTIIELLVVVAIISVMASIVLVSVGLYTSKAKDAAVKANMSSMTTAALLLLDNSGGYVGLCTDATSGFVTAFNEAKRRMKGGGTSNCSSNATQWAASVQLNNSSFGSLNDWWCVDYSGTKKELSADPGAVTTCP